MIVQPLDYALIIWFVLALASAVYVGIDQYRNNPEPVVMKWGFILVTLYLGPLGLLLYVLADKEPAPGQHEQFVKPLWKQSVGSTIHCVAGDATGIISAAAITAMLGLPMWLDLIVEYVAGFTFGLFIFQALFMQSMMGGSYVENVRKSFMPEFISMNFMMAGMAPTMSFLMMGRDMRAMDPTELLFWAVMSIGVMVGFMTAYPANVWMVAQGMKHGLMTSRPDAVDADHHAHDEKSAKTSPADPHTLDHSLHGSGHQQHHVGQGESTSHAGIASMMDMMDVSTRPQKFALAGVSLLALFVGLFAPANWLNLRLSARDVGGLIMPKGMIMDRDTPADAMRDMAASDPRRSTAVYDLTAKGDRELPFRLEDGVKVFELKPVQVRWRILPGVLVDAFAYNGQVPGPRIHIRQGDRVRIKVTNGLPDKTTVHWHGLILPNQMDGPSEVTQQPILPGASYTYEFTATQHGTYFYHPHAKPDRTQALGLYGALIIDPANPADEVPADHDVVVQLQEWLIREGLTYPAMPMDGGHANYFTINGRAYPSTEKIEMKVGETLKVRFIGTNTNSVHPMHIHGGPFEVVARDGETIAPSARFLSDTVNVGPGQRYDVVWKARLPGKWLLHCHIPHHTSNNNVEQNGGGGLLLVIDVQ